MSIDSEARPPVSTVAAVRTALPLCFVIERTGRDTLGRYDTTPPLKVTGCVTITHVELIAKERDRLLQRSARMIGIGSAIVALACFAIPGVLAWTTLLATLPLFAVLVFSHVRLGASQSAVWALVGIVAGLGILVVIFAPIGGPAGPSLGTALVPLAGGSVAAFAIVLTTSGRRIAMLVIGLVAAVVLTELAAGAPASYSFAGVSVAIGWVLAAVFGYWLSASVPRAARRIYSIGRAHRAERQASETEAQRRQGARLLHDTVLATLTMLAHSGVGVAATALQQQANDDARLLRQLRLGATPTPQSSGGYNLEPVEETALGTTLESVKQRFGRMGLEVSWHGTGQVLLPSDVLDAFLLALAECLENVRRHSGVTDAHVTITDDDTIVRAMVTDAGVGFDIKDIDEARMGFKDSVVGRLKEVGGSARLFSSKGAGTTVVLEVPK
ncbi:MAG: histidine kinase [Microbacteriaceae bacterium]|nr:histidine kinase [Microbacteriaceae bacterium]